MPWALPFAGFLPRRESRLPHSSLLLQRGGRQSHLGQATPRLRFLKERAQGGHRRPIPPVRGNRKIVPLAAEGKKCKAVRSRNRLDGQPPVGPVLADRGGHGIMGSDFHSKARRPTPSEQAVEENPRP